MSGEKTEKPMLKAQIIKALEEGLKPAEIAEKVGATKRYVYLIREAIQ